MHADPGSRCPHMGHHSTDARETAGRIFIAMAIETTSLRELLRSLGSARKVSNLNFATNAIEEIENLKREDPSMLNASAYSVAVGAVCVVLVLDEEGGPAFSQWRPYSYFVDNSRLLSSKVNP